MKRAYNLYFYKICLLLPYENELQLTLNYNLCFIKQRMNIKTVLTDCTLSKLPFLFEFSFSLLPTTTH